MALVGVIAIAVVLRGASLAMVTGQRADPDTPRVLPSVEARQQGGYAFIKTLPDGSPVTYDPCEPIRYAINPQGAPPGLDGVIQEAAHSVSERTGLALEFVGTSTAGPDQPPRWGGEGQPPPVVVLWSTEAQAKSLSGDVAGFGGSTVWAPMGPDSARYVTGMVLLDAEDIARMPGGRDQARAVVMHELGHVVGLDHVEDQSELMYATTSGQYEWGPGDSAGLALVGQGRCWA